MLAGDAAGNLTPLGVLASEPTKILMSRTRISTVTSIASVAIENAFYIASVGIVLLAGTWIFLQRADVPAGLEQISEAHPGGGGDHCGRRCLGRAHAAGGVIAPRAAGHEARRTIGRAGGRDSRSRVANLRRAAMARDAHPARRGWEALFHVLAVAEVWMVLRLLPGGDQITAVDAFLMESAGRFVTIAFKFVPYRLGIDEAGSGAVSHGARSRAGDGRHARARTAASNPRPQRLRTSEACPRTLTTEGTERTETLLSKYYSLDAIPQQAFVEIDDQANAKVR